MNRTEEMLAGSTSCYREILELFEQIRADIGKGASAGMISRRFERLKELFSRAEKSNAVFEAEAEKAGPLPSDNPYLLEWNKTVSRVLDENRRMRKYLHSAMAVTKHEMETLGAAKKALGGYRGPGGFSSTGTRINIRSG